ncbi:hypothetical protein TI39_contig4388g00001 [Zymoseptoria brevis]|uniref:Uncharacterized protein n=1 Tax=Zymoseptoria brevis TaxID=1047168 RepID=A0A0F4G6Z0_9PEZI|nr:hypothetical protein TI39_contig4388g00001 [Zymoseptoria brevis]
MVQGRGSRVTQSDLTPKQMAEKAVEETIKTMWCSPEQVDDWLLAHDAKQDVQGEIDKEEEEVNLMHGLPSVIDHGDVFEPEGREYRRMVEGAADGKQASSLGRAGLLAPTEFKTDDGWKSFASKREN